MIKITIAETARCSLRSEPQIHNEIIEYCENSNDVQSYLVNRYGKLPGGRNKVYIDDCNGNAIEKGFTHSYWNVYSEYQTDWVTFEIIETTPITYKQAIRG